MSIYGAAILVFGIFGAPIPSVSNKDKAKIEKNLLQGKWELVKVEICGKTYLPEQIGGGVYLSRDGEIVVCKNSMEAFMKLRYFPIYGVGVDKNMAFSGDKYEGACEMDGQILSGESKYKIDVSRNPRRIIFIYDKDHDSTVPLDYPEPLYIYSVSKEELRLCFGIGKYPSDFKTHKNKKTCLMIYKKAEK